MSDCVYVGPYACWLVPKGRAVPRIDVRTPDEAFILACNAGPDFQNPLPTLVVNRREAAPYCYMPYQERPGWPARRLYYRDWTTVPSVAEDLSAVNLTVDLLAIDKEAEISWFASAYAAELKTLKSMFAPYSRSCRLQWGVVAWEWDC